MLVGGYLNLQGNHMSPLIDSIRSVMNSPRGRSPICPVCRRRVVRDDERVRQRGGTVVHRACATYDKRRRRTGEEPLGHPGGGR